MSFRLPTGIVHPAAPPPVVCSFAIGVESVRREHGDMKYRIPEQLETERLILRMFKEPDWRDLHEYYSDGQCTKYTTGRILTEPESWREMAIRAGHWLLRGYGPYALEERASGRVVGIAGLWYPLEWPEPEITWHLVRRCWGQGLAREAVRAIHRMALEYAPETAWISVIHPENTASIKLALAVGAQFEKLVTFRNGQWHLYRHSRQTNH
jgi:RimJ/RimL family protein N-acetyltransferase